MQSDDKLDDPILGVEAIGRAAKVFTDKAGRIDTRAVYYALERGHLDASKFGKRWVSTARRIRNSFAAVTG
jgi:hypothetical protein